MKKMLLSAGLLLSLSMPTFAGNIDVAPLNEKLAGILLPIQNQMTQAGIKFEEIDIDKTRTNSVTLNVHYHKKGHDNQFGLNVDNLHYAYNDGKPRLTLAGSVNFDLTKVVPREELNEMFLHAPELVEGIAVDMFGDYYNEDYMDIQGVVTSLDKDYEGNYTGFTAIISSNVADMSKVPEEYKEDIVYTKAVLSISLDAKAGVHINGYLDVNPAYRYFQEDESGLKEFLEGLINSDMEVIQLVSGIIYGFDGLITELLEDDSSFKAYMTKHSVK